MKEPLKAPFILLFTLICTTVILTALNLLVTWGLSDSAARPFGLAYVVARAPRSMFEVLIPSMVLSILLFGLRMARRPFSRFLGLVIVLLESYIVLVNGMLLLRGVGAKGRVAAEAPRQYLAPATLVKVDTWILSANAVSENRLRGVLLFDTTRNGARFSVYPAATASVQAGSLTVSAPGITVSGKPDQTGNGVFAPDRFTGLFLRDVGVLVADFERLLSRSVGEFFAACFALLFLCTASLAMLRLTRWPLANIMLLAIALRGYFSLYHLLADTLSTRIASAVADPVLARLLPSAVFAALAVVLLLIDILFIPADRWTKKEVA